MTDTTTKIMIMRRVRLPEGQSIEDVLGAKVVPCAFDAVTAEERQALIDNRIDGSSAQIGMVFRTHLVVAGIGDEVGVVTRFFVDNECEAIGLIALLSELVLDGEPPSRLESLVPASLAPLGETEHGWRLDVCLRRLYASLPERARSVVDGDALSIPTPIWEQLTGEVVSG